MKRFIARGAREVRIRGGASAVLLSALNVLAREGPRGVWERLKRVGTDGSSDLNKESDLALTYAAWLRHEEDLRRERRKPLIEVLEAASWRPVISVIMPVFDPVPEHLDAAIWSIRNQSYHDWQLCICDDGSRNESVREVISAHAAADSRVLVTNHDVNGGISRASNTALSLASGDWIALVDHDDLLDADALLEVAGQLVADPGVDIVYTDEDKLDQHGRRVEPFFKPDWSPHLAMAQAYLGHLVCIKAASARLVGGWRTGFEGAQDYDLWLRVANLGGRVVHIPRVLYHWRMHLASTALNHEAKPYAHGAGKRAVRDFALNRYGQTIVADVEDGRYPLTYLPKFTVPDDTLVSIIVPTKDRVDLLRACLDSIASRSTWTNFEVIVLDNESLEESSKKYLASLPQQDPRYRVIAAAGPFNWSRINNLGARSAKGDVLIFMNNDMEVIAGDWIEALARYALLDDVGLVGGHLQFPDGTIQHAGVVVGMESWAGHVQWGRPALHRVGPFVSPMLTRNVMAVTGALLAVARRRFEDLGGFDEEFVICGSDVELGIRAHKRGFLNVYCAEAILLHHESKSRRGIPIPDQDFQQSARKYEPFRTATVDPFFNPNLSLESTAPTLRSR